MCLLIDQGTKLGPLRNHDIKVTIGQDNCTNISVAATLITCKPPPSQPHALVGSGLPEVIVSQSGCEICFLCLLLENYWFYLHCTHTVSA